MSACACAFLVLGCGESLFLCSMYSTVPGVLASLNHAFLLSAPPVGSAPSEENPRNLGMGSCVTNLCTVVEVCAVKGLSGSMPFLINSTSPSCLSVMPAASVSNHLGPQVSLAPVELKCTCAPARCICPPAPCNCCPSVYDVNPSLA